MEQKLIAIDLDDAKFHGQRQSGPVTRHRQEFWQIVASSIKELPLLVNYYRQTSGMPKMYWSPRDPFRML